jgi:hypothetical protein
MLHPETIASASVTVIPIGCWPTTCADAACAVAAAQAARKTDISAFETMLFLQDELLNRLL